MNECVHFSTTDLSWVLSAYTLTFGGLLLLGGFAQEPWQLLAARALQGVGGAIALPTSLALITTTFPEGPARKRAFGVFAAVSAGGGAIGLLAGGMLTEWLDWRWVLFVNVPIGLLIAFLTPRFINESARHPGRFDLAGALSSTLGMTALVYGFIRASGEGWRDSLTIVAFVAAGVLLAAFAAVESRAREPITPLRMFADHNRSGTYVIMLSLAAAVLGMFFFIVLFVQNVLGYSPIRSGLAFLPVTLAIGLGAGLAQRMLPDLGPMLVFGFGMGLNFVTLTLTAVSGVAPHEAGAASGLLNATQQVGGSLGLSILVTVFGTAGRDEGRQLAPEFLAEATPEQKERFAHTPELPPPWSHDVLTAGISLAFTAAVVMALVAFVTAVTVIRVRKRDLAALGGTAEAAGPAV